MLRLYSALVTEMDREPDELSDPDTVPPAESDELSAPDTLPPGEAAPAEAAEADDGPRVWSPLAEPTPELPSPWDQLRGHPRFRQFVAGAAVLALLIAGGVALSVRSGTEGPTRAADQFLGYLNAFDYQRAAAMTDPQCSNGTNAAMLSGVFSGRNFQHELVSSDTVNSGSRVKGTVDVAGVGQLPVTITLRNVDNDWRVCGIAIR